MDHMAAVAKLHRGLPLQIYYYYIIYKGPSRTHLYYLPHANAFGNKKYDFKQEAVFQLQSENFSGIDTTLDLGMARIYVEAM